MDRGPKRKVKGAVRVTLCLRAEDAAYLTEKAHGAERSLTGQVTWIVRGWIDLNREGEVSREGTA